MYQLPSTHQENALFFSPPCTEGFQSSDFFSCEGIPGIDWDLLPFPSLGAECAIEEISSHKELEADDAELPFLPPAVTRRVLGQPFSLEQSVECENEEGKSQVNKELPTCSWQVQIEQTGRLVNANRTSSEEISSHEEPKADDAALPFLPPAVTRRVLDQPFSLEQSVECENEEGKSQANKELPTCFRQAQIEQREGLINPNGTSLQIEGGTSLEARLHFHKNYLTKRITNTPSHLLQGKILFQEIVSRGYQGSFKTMERFLTKLRAELSCPEAALKFHEAYLIERLKEGTFCAPTGATLFRDIQAKGYRGSLRHVQKFVRNVRLTNDFFVKARLKFHEEYLIKRIREAGSLPISAPKLVEEIKAKGYLGSVKSVQVFIKKVRDNEGLCLNVGDLIFYKAYLVKRVKEAWPHRLSGPRLFKEVELKGYRGSLKSVQTLLSAIQRALESLIPPEAYLCFHKYYLINRLEAMQSRPLSYSVLFKEIKAKGYRGSCSDVRAFLKKMGYAEHFAEKGVGVYEGYLITRLEEASHPLSTSQLFKEIRIKGYQGTLKAVEMLVQRILRRGLSQSRARFFEASFRFHKDYLVKRLKEAYPCSPSSMELFKEIKAKGYRGSFKTVRSFVTIMRRGHQTPEAYLHFHKPYLIERIREAAPHRLPAALLFREIKAKGYRGSLRPLQVFLSCMQNEDPLLNIHV